MVHRTHQGMSTMFFPMMDQFCADCDSCHAKGNIENGIYHRHGIHSLLAFIRLSTTRFLKTLLILGTMEQKEICLSCKVRLTNMTGSVRFKCPKCGKGDITRCAKCKKIGTMYTCPQCSFEGPN